MRRWFCVLVPACGSPFRLRIVRQFHDVKEVARGIIPTDMQHVQLARMPSGNRLEPPDALHLAFVRPAMLERAAVNHLYGSELPKDISRQPHLAVAAAPDDLEQLMIGDFWGRFRGKRTRLVVGTRFR